MELERIGENVLDCAFKVHSELGPGLLESTYEACLAYELRNQGLEVSRQQVLPVKYRGVQLDEGYRIDLLVENRVIVELKAIDKLKDIHLAQVISYLKLSGNKLGYLLNFNVRHMRDGIRRVVNEI